MKCRQAAVRSVGSAGAKDLHGAGKALKKLQHKRHLRGKCWMLKCLQSDKCDHHTQTYLSNRTAF